MIETLDMVRITNLPVIVIKQELADLPLFGWMTRSYGVIPVERSAGPKAFARWWRRASEPSLPGDR